MSANPFSPPKSDPAPGETTAPTALYSINAVALATFLGSLLGGGLVLAQNYRRLGQLDKGVKTIAVSFVSGSLLMAGLMMIPESVPIPSVVYLMPQLLGMRALAQHLQGETIAAHEGSNGKIASNWGAAGLGLIGMIVMLAIAVVLGFMLPGVET